MSIHICFRCHHYDCYGFDWCICETCDQLKEYSALVSAYCEAVEHEEYAAADKIKEQLDAMATKIERRNYR